MLNIFKKKNGVQQTVKCELCGMEFAEKSRLVKHKEKAHPKGR
jgi:uncharacterized C2H2 Zn-finger protein